MSETFEEIQGRLVEDVLRLSKRLDEFNEEIKRLEQSYEDARYEEELGEGLTDTASIFADVYQGIEDLKERCKRLIATLKGMSQPAIEDSEVREEISQFEQRAIQAFTEIGAIHAELTYVQAELRHLPYRYYRKRRRRGSLGSVRNATQSVVIYLRQQLFPLIKKISARLYNWIIQFVTPKGWSIGGEIGVNLVFQSKATLRINFGS